MKEEKLWPRPHLVDCVNSQINLVNDTQEPVVLKKHEKVCKVYPTSERLPDLSPQTPEFEMQKPRSKVPLKKLEPYSKLVTLNADNILTPTAEAQFKDLIGEYDDVFDPNISQYNGRSGPCSVDINIGPNQPPQHRGREANYCKGDRDELQRMCDELEAKGVLARPEKIGVKVEYISPSFLVKKASGGYRLVTDFTALAPYIKPVPAKLPDTDTTLRMIAPWKYLIKTDLIDAYFQLYLRHKARKYCGISTPYKGVRVYTTGVMGLPGVEVALEELTCIVLGDLVMRGCVAKLADDLYIGGSTEQELLENLKLVLHRLRENNLRLSARKTVIAPKSTVILGWVWSGGKLQASAHRISALASCPRPVSVSAMKSFIGSFRFLCRVLEGYAVLLAPLETYIAGKDPKCSIEWNSELESAFDKAQSSLQSNKAITLPIPSDVLWIVTDGSLSIPAIGATLYVVRDGTPKLGGFFSARLPIARVGWLACEVEGVAIASALHHYAPIIRQSLQRPHVLTDSKPCIQASEKFSRGEFSTSARLATFLNAVGTYRAIIGHVAGKANLVSDFASRSPVQCSTKSCEVCKFVSELCDSVVGSISIQDLLQGKVHVPFTNRAAWLDTQKECSDLEKVRFYLQQGTSPSRKQKRLKDVRRYMFANVLLARDGLLIVRTAEPLGYMVDRIVVPRSVCNGLLMALHIQCSHLSGYQLKKLASRYFFSLDMDEAITRVSEGCEMCAAMKKVPRSLVEQTSEKPPESIGFTFACDVVRREGQKIFILRETVTSNTTAQIVNNETAASLGDAVVSSVSKFRPSNSSAAIVRVDAASAFQSLFQKLDLSQHNISIDIGRFKNKNKNPVIDRAIQELIRELHILNPIGGPISAVTLDLAVAAMNSRIRATGLSAQELWTGRDQASGAQLDYDDKLVIQAQAERRDINHKYSEKAKAWGKPSLPRADISVGDLVYVYSDGNKISPRPDIWWWPLKVSGVTFVNYTRTCMPLDHTT